MFYNRAEGISDQFDHLKLTGFKVLVILFCKKKQQRDYLGIISFKEGGPLFLNVYVRILTKNEKICVNKKCFLGPKMPNKTLFFIWTEASQLGGRGGEREKETVFFSEGLPN